MVQVTTLLTPAGSSRILARMPILLLTTFQIAAEQRTEAGVGLAGGACSPIELVCPLSSFSHKKGQQK